MPTDSMVATKPMSLRRSPHAEPRTVITDPRSTRPALYSIVGPLQSATAEAGRRVDVASCPTAATSPEPVVNMIV